MQCFNNFIGIYRNTTNPATGGVYISDLEGMNYARLEAIMRDDTDVDVEAFVQRKIDFAMQLVLDDIKGYLNPSFRVNTILEGYKDGAFNGDDLAVYAGERGCDIEIERTNLSRIYIAGAWVRATPTDDIYQRTLILNDGLSVNTYAFILPDGGGEIYVPINYKAESDTVELRLDNTTLLVDDGRFKACTSCSNQSFKGSYFTLNGYSGTGTTSKIYGILPEFSIVCDDEQLLCMLKPRLNTIMLYKSGIELLKEALSSENYNWLTIYRDEEIKEKLAEWKVAYDERWKILINNLPEFIRNLQDEVCIKCTSNRYLG